MSSPASLVSSSLPNTCLEASGAWASSQIELSSLFSAICEEQAPRIYDELDKLRFYCERASRLEQEALWRRLSPTLVFFHLVSDSLTLQALYENDPATFTAGGNLARALQIHFDHQLAWRYEEQPLEQQGPIHAYRTRDISFFNRLFWDLSDEIARAFLDKQELGQKVIGFRDKGLLSEGEVDALLRRLVSPKSVSDSYHVPFVEELFTPLHSCFFPHDVEFQKRSTLGDNNCCYNAMALSFLGLVDEGSYQKQELIQHLQALTQLSQEQVEEQVSRALSAYQGSILGHSAPWQEAQQRLAPLLRQASIAILRSQIPDETLTHELQATFMALVSGQPVMGDLFTDVRPIQTKMQQLAQSCLSGTIDLQAAQDELAIWFVYGQGWQAYLDQMQERGTWGGIVELRALSQHLGVHLALIQLHSVSLDGKRLAHLQVVVEPDQVVGLADFTVHEIAILNELGLTSALERQGEQQVPCHLLSTLEDYPRHFDLERLSPARRRRLQRHIPSDQEPWAYLQALQERFRPFAYVADQPIIGVHNPHGVHWSAMTLEGAFDLRRQLALLAQRAE